MEGDPKKIPSHRVGHLENLKSRDIKSPEWASIKEQFV